jgi:hypothetical protein
MSNMQHADYDLFQQLGVVGSALAAEGGIIANFLLGEQAEKADAQLKDAASKLIPLEQELAQGMARVEHLRVDLGIEL